MPPQRRGGRPDFGWSVIQPSPPKKPCDVPQVDERKVITRIFWPLRTGSLWNEVPDSHGS
jgi:hypothetical protein